jgi:hypothetical protein
MASYSPRNQFKNRQIWIPRCQCHRLARLFFDPAVSLTPRNLNFASDYLDFLGQYEAMCETALARDSGPRGDYLMKKTEGRKYRDTAPFKYIVIYVTVLSVYFKTLLKHYKIHLSIIIHFFIECFQ